MIDESFHLTPLDVRRTEFPAALRGYDRARVDEFRDRVANELERLTRLNHELENKAKGFHEQLRAFRERDKALNEALVSAQQLRAETRDQAEREAQLSLREAKAEGDRLIDAAKSEVRRLAGEIEALERSRRAYLAQLRSMVARQLAELDAIREGDRTLLDRSLVLNYTDSGYAKNHTTDNIPLLTAGSAGGRMKTGIHFAASKGDPVTRVSLTVQQAVGVPIDSFGTESNHTTKTITEVMA